MVFIIGLTGGIGSGKTTVERSFSRYHIPLIDADRLAREVVDTDPVILNKILSYFGEKILTPTRELNRLALRQHIFDSASDRQWLEDLLHPLITLNITKKINELKDHPYCLLSVPLLFETGPYFFIDHILVVDAPIAQQIKRTIARDNIHAQLVHDIMHRQCSRFERLIQADSVIYNDFNLATLDKQVDDLHRFFMEKARVFNKPCEAVHRIA
jgi:dephospho-CoA kinase